MAEINLLKQSSGAANNWNFAYLFWIRLLVAIVILMLAYYVWLFFHLKNVTSTTIDTQNKINSEVQQSLSSPDRNEFLTRQLQLQNLQTILSQHVYWSHIFPLLAQDTYKTVTYSSLTADTSDNTITLQASVPTLGDLDAYTQAFNLPQVYKNFSNVYISGFNQSQAQNQPVTSVNFSVKMQFNPSIIQYQSPSL